MAISIVKSESKIAAVVAAIAAKSGAYKETVSSAVLSAVAHAIEHGDYSLITKVISEVQAVNPRDLKVVGAFLQSVTPFKIESEKAGRVDTYKVICRMEKDCAVNEADFKTRKDFEKAVKTAKDKAAKRDKTRCDVFARFVGSLKDEKGEPMPRGAMVPNSEKEGEKVCFDYQLNIFAWFDDVNYYRNGGSDNGGKGETAFDFDSVFVSKVASLIKACKDQQLTAEQTAALEAVTAFYNAASQRKSDKEESEKAQSAEKSVIEKQTKALKDAGATESEIAAWFEHRVKRIGQGKTAENIDIEFKAHVKAMKAAKAAAEIATANDSAAA